MQTQKNIKSPLPKEELISRPTKIQVKTSQTSLRGTLKRYKKPKQFQLINQPNRISIDDQSTQIQQGSFSSKNHFKNAIPSKQSIDKDNFDGKKGMKFETKKQTFKDFIKKIQMHNKNKIIHQLKSDQQQNSSPNHSQINLHNTQICIPSDNKSTIFNQLSLEMVQKKQNDQNSLVKYAQNCLFSIRTKQLKTKNIITIKSKDNKSKQFIINEPLHRSEYSHLSKRSKTEQEIKFDIRDENNNTKIVDDDKNLKQTQKQQKASNGLTSLHIANSKKPSIPINHLSLKLMPQFQPQQQKEALEFHTEQRLNTVDSSKGLGKFKDRDLTKHKKLLQTKYSKIRIRFGSSLYNKRLWRFDSKCKESLRKQLQSICTEDLITLKHKQRDRKPSINSIFCQNKILQAQNAFIQKRRLLPNNSTEIKQDPNKTNKRFFSVTNSFKRHKTMEFQGRPQKGQKVENINGWQILDEGYGGDKIEEFF